MISAHRFHRVLVLAAPALLMTHCLGRSTQDGDTDGTSTTAGGDAGFGSTSTPPMQCWEAETVDFHDPAFERGVLNALERAEGPVTGSEAKEVSHITVVGATSVEDVKCLPSLVMLRLDGGSVEDLAPLDALSDLAILHLINLPAHDLSPLVNQPLTSLIVIDTPVSDLSPLGTFDSLIELTLQNAEVSDISLIGRQAELTFLDLSESPVAELTALSGLEELSRVRLDGTNVTDLTPLGDASFAVDCPRVSALDIPVDAEGPGGLAALCEAGWGVTWSPVGSSPVEACPCGFPDE